MENSDICCATAWRIAVYMFWWSFSWVNKMGWEIGTMRTRHAGRKLWPPWRSLVVEARSSRMTSSLNNSGKLWLAGVIFCKNSNTLSANEHEAKAESDGKLQKWLQMGFEPMPPTNIERTRLWNHSSPYPKALNHSATAAVECSIGRIHIWMWMRSSLQPRHFMLIQIRFQ